MCVPRASVHARVCACVHVCVRVLVLRASDCSAILQQHSPALGHVTSALLIRSDAQLLLEIVQGNHARIIERFGHAYLAKERAAPDDGVCICMRVRACVCMCVCLCARMRAVTGLRTSPSDGACAAAEGAGEAEEAGGGPIIAAEPLNVVSLGESD
jgi:hypothetical protein